MLGTVTGEFTRNSTCLSDFLQCNQIIENIASYRKKFSLSFATVI